MQKQSFSVFADYYQFYLWDEEASPEPPINWTDEDVARRLKAEANVVAVCPVRNMTVPVEMEIHETEPAYDAAAWDHIAECSLNLPSGKLQVHECTGGPVANFRVSPGTYRVRAFYGSLGSLSEDGLDGNDHYHIVLWPAAHRDLAVIKNWTGDK